MKLGRSLLMLVPLAPLAVFFGSVFLLGYSSGPDPRMTGGFKEDTCRTCHNSYALNEGSTFGGVFQIQGVPKAYEAGKTYPLRVVIGHPGKTRWGFELSARFSGTGGQAGQLVPTDLLTQVKEDAGIQYIEHTTAGTRQGTGDGPVEFHFNWTAPSPVTAPVVFNASGNASDGDGNPTGDYIYSAGAYSGVPGQGASQPGAPSELTEAKRPPRLSESSLVANLPAPVDLKKHSVEIYIQHRFLQSLADGRPGNAFGVDSGANINLGFNYAITNRLSFGASRARFGQIITFAGNYEIQTRQDSFWKLSLHAGVEGTNNFERNYSPFLQLTSSFDYKILRLYVVPSMVFNSRIDSLLLPGVPAINPQDDHTFSIGVGADIALTPKLSLLGEVVPRVAGFGGIGTNDYPSVSTGIAIRTWGHVFTILASSSRDFTPAAYAVNAGQHNLSLGFNIYRRVH